MKELLIDEVLSTRTGLMHKLGLITQNLLGEPLVDSLFMDRVVQRIEHHWNEQDDPLERAELLLDALYNDLLLVEDDTPTSPTLRQHEIGYALAHRQFAPALKLILLVTLMTLAGFEADVVYVPEKLMVRLICDEQYAIVIDATTGEPINWVDLDSRLNQSADSAQSVQLQALSPHCLILNYLMSLQQAFNQTKHYAMQLQVADLINAILAGTHLQDSIIAQRASVLAQGYSDKSFSGSRTRAQSNLRHLSDNVTSQRH